MFQRAIVRVPAYLTFGFAVFMIALVLTFPDQRIKEIIIVQIEKQLHGKYDVTIDRLGLWWLSGVKLKNIKFTERIIDTAPKPAGKGDADGADNADNALPAKEPLVVNIPQVAAGFAPLLSAMNFAPTVDFLVDLGGGDIRGNFVQGKTQRALKLNIKKMDLSKTSALKSLLDLPMHGTLSAQAELELAPRRPQVTRGDIKVQGTKLLIDQSVLRTDKLGPMGFIDVPETDLGQLDIHLTIAQAPGKPASMLEFKEFRFHGGEDVRGEVWGDIELGATRAQGNARVEMRFQFDDKYIRSNNLSDVLRMGYFREGKNQDWYGFMLWGRLNAPRFKGSPTAATGPKPADDKAPDTKVDEG